MAKLLRPEVDEAGDGRSGEGEDREEACERHRGGPRRRLPGVSLAINIVAMLIAFIALISLFNGGLSWVGGKFRDAGALDAVDLLPPLWPLAG